MINPGQVNLGEVKIRSLQACPPSVQVGDPVYQTGAGTVDLADCRDANKMPCVGIVESKPSPTSCWVVTQGKVENALWGLSVKDTYFVGPGTGIVLAAGVPATPGTYIHEIGYAYNSTTVMCQLDRDFTVRS